MRLKFFILFIFIYKLASFGVLAQNANGGKTVFNFLSTVPSARMAALGGMASASPAADVQLAWYNPALLRDTMHQQISFSYVNYLADIALGQANMAFKLPKHWTLGAGIQYIRYGNFKATDPNGTYLGDFTAGETAIQASVARPLVQYWSFGASIKYVMANYYTHRTSGIGADAGLWYYNPKKDLSFTFLIRNAGVQLNAFQSQKGNLPLDIQIGFAKKPEHLPARFYITAHSLNRINNRYNDPNDPFYRQVQLLPNGDPAPDTAKYILDKAMRHITLGTEILFSKHFNVRFGYNYLRRAEAALPTRSGFSGFSWGFGLRISKFQFHYANAGFFTGQNTNCFSIVTALQDFKRKPKS